MHTEQNHPVLKTLNASTLSVPEVTYDMALPELALRQDCLHIVGFGFDGTACFRKGTVKGPDAIREVALGIETYSPYLDRTTEDCFFIDLGNLELGSLEDKDADEQDRIKAQWQGATDNFLSIVEGLDIAKNKVRFLTLGGEHSISYASIKTYLEAYPDLVLIHLDAHADLRDGYEGYHFSHASIIRRALDHFGPKHKLIQYGIRSGTKEEYSWMQEHSTIKTSRDEFFSEIEKIDPKRPVYLTLDLDYFDPSFMPGTGTPEPGGEDFHSFIKLTKLLKNKNFVGADVVELSPDIDSSGNSSVFSAKVVREIILLLAH